MKRETRGEDLNAFSQWIISHPLILGLEFQIIYLTHYSSGKLVPDLAYKSHQWV